MLRFVLEGEQDPLAVLGLTSSATPDDIKQAYRQQAMRLHPDRHPGDANAARRFQELGEAYTELTGESTFLRAEPRVSSLWWWLLVALIAFAALCVMLR